MVAHVVSYDDLGARGILQLVAQGRFHLGRIHAAAQEMRRGYRELPRQERESAAR